MSHREFEAADGAPVLLITPNPVFSVSDMFEELVFRLHTPAVVLVAISVPVVIRQEIAQGELWTFLRQEAANLLGR
jgi:hypothetical protein